MAISSSQSQTAHSNRPTYELAQILRQYLPQYLRSHRISPWQRKILHQIQVCRTAYLGGHLEVCDHCAYEEPAYNSCHNRHCPKCLGIARARWVSARMEELLPVPYYHLVFTLPHRLNTLALYNKTLLYNLFYEAVSYTLLRFGRDAKHLGAQIGFIAVLHTWGKGLCTHIHWHVILPGGGLTDDSQWRALPHHDKFVFPVHAMSRVVRARFIKLLRNAYDRGELEIPQAYDELRNEVMFEYFLNDLAADKWVCYAKPPFGGPEQVLKYLGRYTHRVALSNHRILGIAQGRIRLNTKNYRQGGRLEITELSAEEFIHRFLDHTLPKRFRKIRYGGFLVCTVRQAKLAQARQALGVAKPALEPAGTEPESLEVSLSEEKHRCPKCGFGVMQAVALPFQVEAGASPYLVANHDYHGP